MAPKGGGKAGRERRSMSPDLDERWHCAVPRGEQGCVNGLRSQLVIQGIRWFVRD